MRLTEVGIKNYKSATILNESWQQLTEAQQIYVGKWETRVWPLVEQYSRLMEAELTPDQIQTIFTSAEKAAIDSGENLTALGKAGKVTAEVSSKMKAEIEKLADAAAKSGPVKNMDAQFDKLRTQLASKLKGNPAGQKILQGVDKWKGFAEENPAKSAFIVGAMTSILAFASGGIVSGAAIGFFLRLANNTIKGDKLSTAIGKGAKGAALGAVAGALGDAIGSDEIEVAKAATQDAPAPITAELDSAEVVDSADGAGAEEVAKELPDLQSAKDAYAERIAQVLGTGDVPYEMIEKISDTLVVEGDYPDGNWSMRLPEGSSMVRGEIFLTPEESAAWDEFRQGKDIGQLLGQEGTDWLKQNVEGADEMISADEAEAAAQKAELKAKYDAMSPEEQKAYDQEQERKYGDFMDYTPPGTPKYESVNVEELWDALDAYELREAPAIGAALAGAAKGIGKAASKTADVVGKAAAKGASKAGSAIAKGAKAAGKELGNKVTTAKLNRMWKKAGSPTDTGSVVNILTQAGLSDELIGTVSKETGVDLPKNAANAKPQAIDLQSLADQIKKAGVADKVKAALASN